MRQKIISCVRGRGCVIMPIQGERLRDYVHTRGEVARLCLTRTCHLLTGVWSGYVCMGVHVSWGPAPLKKVTTNTNCVPYISVLRTRFQKIEHTRNTHGISRVKRIRRHLLTELKKEILKICRFRK